MWIEPGLLSKQLTVRAIDEGSVSADTILLPLYVSTDTDLRFPGVSVDKPGRKVLEQCVSGGKR